MTKFIAEICSNYIVNGVKSLDRAKQLIKAAKRSGADIVKFQYFRGEDLVNVDFRPKLVDSFKDLELPDEWLPELASECAKNDVEFMVSVFDPKHIEKLNGYVKRWKIASWELFSEPHVNPLFVEIAKTGKPVIMSTAGATIEEVDYCANVLAENGLSLHDLTILHCDPGYPISLEESELNRIADLGAELFPVSVGYSAHLVNPVVVAASVMYFAEVIEVHFDLEDKGGVESGHSFTPNQFKEMVMTANMLNIARSGTPKRPEFALGEYRKNPEDWKRPLMRD
jgi:sialic acid synthase SpsE